MEELYREEAVDAVTLNIVYRDDGKTLSQSSFKPIMAHQIFGTSEMVFGYRHLHISINFMHNSFKCYLMIKYGKKLEANVKCKPDDILALLTPWLPTDLVQTSEEFNTLIASENHKVIYGELLHRFTGRCAAPLTEFRTSEYKIMLCDTANEEFRQFHDRFQSLIIWFIDGANFIDLTDSKWLIFYLYEELANSSDEIIRSPIGYCSVYRFFCYPASTRARISQFFILPSHQKLGLGTKLYQTVFKYLSTQATDVHDITVEEPTEVLQKMRDCHDSEMIYKELKKRNLTLSITNTKQILNVMQSLKLSKRQALRVLDILGGYNAQKNGTKCYEEFTVNTIKARIKQDYEKNSKSKRRMTPNAVAKDITDSKENTETEFRKYVSALEPVIAHLKKQLAT